MEKNTLFNPKDKIDNLILRILNSQVSEFEIISEITNLVNSETIILFYDDFNKKYKALSDEFFLGIDEKYIVQAVSEAKTTRKEYLPYISLCDYELKILKNFSKKIDGIDCFFNAHGFGNSQNPKVKEYLFLNDLMIEFNSMYGFFEENKEFEDYYNTFGDLRKLKRILKYIEKKAIQPQQAEPEAIDLSDTSNTEKIIYLQKLGVIDFLRTKQPFLSSINSLATVLSAVTGAKTETIQPMLNPMISKEAGQKNNPLNSKNTVSKVETQLINIGFNLNETN